MGRVQAIQLEYSDSYQVCINKPLTQYNINSTLFNSLQFEPVHLFHLLFFHHYLLLFTLSGLNLRYLTL